MRLDGLLAESAARTPDAIAATETGGLTIAYRQLDLYAEEVRRTLVEQGVCPGDRVGLCVEKSIAALASVFGILKAGAAYVPVDASAPAVRNGYIFNDCAVKAIVVGRPQAHSLMPELAGGGWVSQAFPAPSSHPADLEILTRETTASETSVPELAYILYTSGSTGRPKGVMHTHASALSFIDWCSERFSPRPEDRFSSHAPFHFDLSILDIYVPIKHGASVVLIGSAAGKQPGTLSALIASLGITVWYSTPSILRMLVEFGKLEEHDVSKLRLVFFAGEVFPIKHLRALMSRWPHPAYFNLYGPTETNVCTYYEVPTSLPADRETPLPIGGACSGDRARVVEANGQDAARGEEGELLIAGGSVMLGYWNLPERDAEVFVVAGGERWYRTGDIVREEEDGIYIFRGRRDRMVKRRGFRVELGEIEASLHCHPKIQEAAVIATAKDDGDVQIHGFVAGTASPPPTLIELKKFCSDNLPLYMVPDRFSVLPELPKTSTDKIDYQRLKGLA